MIEAVCNEVLGNYTKKEDQLMTAAFGIRPKRRLNRVMDALNFDYPDYERLNKGAEGQKRKRVVSVFSRQAARMVKEDEEAAKKRKSSPKPKVATPASKKRKSAALKPKATGIEEETPSTPSAAEVEEILKVMTESLPIKLLCPLGPQLTKLLQKKDSPSAAKKEVEPKRQRIVTVMQAIEKTPPRVLASKIVPPAEAASTEAATAEASSAEAATAEAANLESMLSNIDRVLLDLAIEEATASTEEVLATVLEKGKKVVEDISEKEEFEFRNLIGQELTKAEKKELWEYAISCGYQTGALLFGGVEEEALGCIRDHTGAKIISSLTQSVGFPKLEANLNRYRRQHITGSLFYSNFKVKFLSTFYCFDNKGNL
jgi:hypothetical protein